MTMRSPLGSVLGHGAAKQGVAHWWNQRLTAVALAPLGLWFVFSLLSLPDLAYATVVAWIAQPFATALLVLLVGTLAFHSSLGVQVVVEDYVHSRRVRTVLIVIVRFVHLLAGVTGIVAVLAVAFGGRA
jgi:succinate dehydrogenase / fumarate reductase membrane anchor subunit